MSALDLLAIYYYGWRVVIVTLVAVVTSVLTDYICTQVMKRKFDPHDPSPAMSGILLALLMPASVPYYVMAFACVFMIAVAKYAFGGNNNLIFSPVAVSYAFSSITWSRYIMRYPTPTPFGSISLANTVSDNLTHSFTYALDNDSAGTFSILDILLGKLAGPMGTGAILLILICGVAMYMFGDIEPTVFFTGIAANVLLGVLFPGNATGWQAFVYTLVSGSYMFTLVFMACDRRFVPKHQIAQFLYAMVIAVSAFLLRKYTSIENGAVFGLLIANIFRDEFDRWVVAFDKHSRATIDKIVASHQKAKEQRALQNEEASQGPSREPTSEFTEDSAEEPVQETIKEDIADVKD